jgi:hypothetical protein
LTVSLSGKLIKRIAIFILLCACTLGSMAQENSRQVRVNFFGDTIQFNLHSSANVSYGQELSAGAIQDFHKKMSAGFYEPIIDTLKAYKQRRNLNDWLYYQLVRRTAQQLAPKADGYYRYTLYKWFLLTRSGYDATLSIYNNELLFYVYSTEDISDVPYYMRHGKQYVCLNIHDYAKADAFNAAITAIDIAVPGAESAFSYKVTRLPAFTPEDYTEKNLQFNYHDKSYHFVVKLNQQVSSIFTNYPGVDFASYFNIPLSSQTYQSLVPLLRKNVKHMKVRKGVDYLMNFTRHAFLYEDDREQFGKEKRMSPEETLLYNGSDCDDRAALFFYLVKEIYNLPMIALGYPSHITVAVLFDKPIGATVLYDGKQYTICEPTPQGNNILRIGELAPAQRQQPYEVVYVYNPKK